VKRGAATAQSNKAENGRNIIRRSGLTCRQRSRALLKSNRLAQVLSVLQKEESLLKAQIGKVRDAIAALGGAAQGVRKAKTGARNARKMTAAQRKAVGLRMKKYWAERRKKQPKA
jgi:hypothetical protein